jgi:excisionase family DNA binding protein
MSTILLKFPEVMERLPVGETKVYELMSTGELRSVKSGRSRRVPNDELERFIAIRQWHRADQRPGTHAASWGSASGLSVTLSISQRFADCIKGVGSAPEYSTYLMAAYVHILWAACIASSMIAVSGRLLARKRPGSYSSPTLGVCSSRLGQYMP